MKNVASALFVSVLFASTFAYADEAAFKAADTDGNGEVTLAEVMAAYPKTVGDAFEESDVNGSGGLDQEEFDEALDSGMLTK